MIFDSSPENTFRPALSALRGMMITLFAFISFFLWSGIDRTKHVWPYLGSVLFAYVLHYISAWLTMRHMRRRYFEKLRGTEGAE